jgi:hypothetical protein
MTHQSDFVLSILGNKKNGTYLEVGAGDYQYMSNSYVLEKEYGWSGIAVEIDPALCKDHDANRNHLCINKNALTINYHEYLPSIAVNKRIDYLQIDIDDSPRHSNLLGLINVPLNDYRFNVITFEHDLVRSYKFKSMRDAQREILDSLGYVLVVPGVAEDWWVDGKEIRYEQYGWAFEAYQKEMAF